MSGNTYTVAYNAYLKIFLHAAKHPHKPVNGVLLGNASGSGKVTIDDAIPLLHHWTSLSPMMEIGLDLARTHASARGLQLVGYYQACERLDETALAPVGERVAGKLREQFDGAIAFVIDGEKLGSEDAALIPYLPSSATSASWRPATTPQLFTLADPSSPARAVAAVHARAHAKFGDFDDHLEDVSVDWLKNEACLAV
ncbi:hypothetical protein PLICRDRAFT_173916 [Plicaturopsis crispa FD-325 SS-3]|nr:hypothetical protein PLICRDRAFT_173916 [Plicaturopsis crispa FD-325 SS-3]